MKIRHYHIMINNKKWENSLFYTNVIQFKITQAKNKCTKYCNEVTQGKSELHTQIYTNFP